MNRFLLILWASLALAQGSSDLVISQVYGGGGNAGAPLRNDFIELFNRGTATIDVSGWSVQYASATGTEWQVTPLAGTVRPGQHYLIQQAAGANGDANPLPSPDVTGTIAMSATAGKVALVRSMTPIAGAVAMGPNLVDLVGYGTASAFETAAAATLSNTTAALRRGSGCVDTDNNAADFQIGPPRPRSSQSEALTSCTIGVILVPKPLLISEIQGSGAESPVAGELVSTRGIVTGRKTNGFFIQSTAQDNDQNPATSEGLFVFTSEAPPAVAAVGNLVQVFGSVQEYRPASDMASPPLTELVDPLVDLIGTGYPIPPAIPLASVTDLETLEGMRVSTPRLRVVGPTGGSVSEANDTATSNGVFFGIEAGGVRPFTSPSGTLGGRIIRVDSRALGRPAALDARAGASTGSISGPLDFAFQTYTIASEDIITIVSPEPPITFVERGTNEFAVASMNLQRLFDAENDPTKSDPVVSPEAYRRRVGKIARVIRESLQSPEIIGVVEVENLPVLQDLAQAAGDYDAYLLEGNDVGGIDVGVLVRKDRVTVQNFTQEGKDAQIDGEVLNDRPPVVLRATVDGLPVVVVVNHLRSLINADSPAVARKRRAQADFLSGLLERERSANLISVGDYNMVQYDPLMQVITSSGVLNLNDTLRPNEAYTYVFNGVTQALDHVLLSPSALTYLTRYQIAHINADYPEATRNSPASLNRISDHDVPIAYFATQPPAFRAASTLHAANYVAGSIAPNQWLTLFTPGPVTQVLAGGTPTQIVFSSASQTTLITPPVFPMPAAPSSASVRTTTLTMGTNSITLPVAGASPGVFTLSGTGRGQGAILNQDLSVNGETNAATRGSVVVLYGSGLGPDNTTVWIGDKRAQVLYSGPAPELPNGIFQVNARVPADAPAGANVPVLVASGDEVSAAGVTLAIR